MKKNGFTMVELLAVVIILGILTSMGVIAYTRYINYTKTKALDILADSSKQAAEQYFMDNPHETSVNIDILHSKGYLESIKDPRDETQSCSGTVRVTDNKNDTGKLETSNYSVSLCCTNYSYTYRYPEKTKAKDINGCKADVAVTRLIEPDSTRATNCSRSNVRAIVHNIYALNYVGKVCDKDSSGQYGACHDSSNPNSKEEYPCRIYDYHQRECECVYSMATNRFCSSSIKSSPTYNDHTMKIYYLSNDSNGEESCKSDASGSINSYVDHICSDGYYNAGESSMFFHGYQFYKGASSTYKSFSENTWFHDGGYYDNRIARGSDIDGEPDYAEGCRNTCINMTEKWMGTVGGN